MSVSGEVLKVIEESWQDYSEQQLASLALLAREEANVVVTGQQLGLFGGRLFTLYKIVTAIKFAELESAAGRPTVPIFWLQVEDHDAAEINDFTYLSKAGEINKFKIEHPSLGTGNRIPVGLLPEYPDQAALLEQYIQNEGVASDLPNLLSKTSQTLLNSFQTIVNKLSSSYGLLFLNPLLLQKTGLTREIYKTALSSRDEIDRLLKARESNMQAAAIDPSVKVIPGSPLFFIQVDEVHHSRSRLNFERGQFKVKGTDLSFSEKELFELIESNPSRFSSSALLRPIIQDKILAPVAYIGGPTEARYLELSEAVYSVFSTQQSKFIPRASFRIVEPRVRRAADKIHPDLYKMIETTTAARLTDRIEQQLIGKNRASDIERLLRDELEILFHSLLKNFDGLGQPQFEHLTKTRDKFDRGAQGIVDSYRRGYEDLAKRQGAQSKIILDSLAPQATEQERYFSWLAFYLKYGDSLIKMLIDGVKAETLVNSPKIMPQHLTLYL